MVDCDYCGDAFDDEEAYLRHLREEHEGELGSIDERRVRALDTTEEGPPTRAIVLAVVGVLALGVAAYVVFFSGSETAAAPTGLEDEPLPNRGAEQYISQVETFPSQGREHVEEGTEIDYARVPPLSGTHYASTVAAGFYSETPPLGSLVHTLEHGGVVIYYDPAALTPEAEASLKAWARNHQGTWTSIVVAPNPSENPQGPYVLTAWRHRLTLQEYDAKAVRAFAAEYLGRGPEHKVR